MTTIYGSLCPYDREPCRAFCPECLLFRCIDCKDPHEPVKFSSSFIKEYILAINSTNSIALQQAQVDDSKKTLISKYDEAVSKMNDKFRQSISSIDQFAISKERTQQVLDCINGLKNAQAIGMLNKIAESINVEEYKLQKKNFERCVGNIEVLIKNLDNNCNDFGICIQELQKSGLKNSLKVHRGGEISLPPFVMINSKNENEREPPTEEISSQPKTKGTKTIGKDKPVSKKTKKSKKKGDTKKTIPNSSSSDSDIRNKKHVSSSDSNSDSNLKKDKNNSSDGEKKQSVSKTPTVEIKNPSLKDKSSNAKKEEPIPTNEFPEIQLTDKAPRLNKQHK